MFFMMGINDEQKELDYSCMAVCEGCGAYCRYYVFMCCTVLSLFFIPCLRWNRRYFVRSGCCGSVFELDGEIGRRIARGEEVEIRPEHLKKQQGGSVRRCSCGYTTQEDFDFCPRCGSRLG